MQSPILNNNRWHESLTHKLWYAMSGTHVVAQVVAVGPPGVFTVACEGPSGLGINFEVTNSTPEHVITRAEQTLLDLGWTGTHDGFACLKELERGCV